ncbi:Solute carrier organic anion transporter family member 4A1 [Eumeta japonica]|uniref:Solute carrier organic anion transporter family member 4A1 n=1 Tax=Eumeta variegata TaxID=151549 RepID=A0A4C1TG07_EUMVA|nr:Solute carrier organic anion transporter family member 4A1 [Eumeta japonica]
MPEHALSTHYNTFKKCNSPRGAAGRACTITALTIEWLNRDRTQRPLLGSGFVVIGNKSITTPEPGGRLGLESRSEPGSRLEMDLDQGGPCSDVTRLGSGDSEWALGVFVVAQLLHGAGAAPLFTLGVTYIDENVSKKMSSVYLDAHSLCCLRKT